MTTSENNFENKCKNMRELFFGKKIVKREESRMSIPFNYIYHNFDISNDEDVKYISYDSINLKNNNTEYCNFDIIQKSKDLSDCDKFYEIFFDKTNSINKESIDNDGIKYYFERDESINRCNFFMKKKI
jgi:hypothetical protein